jgi:hypothetical protein
MAETFLNYQMTGVMGPCVRRDDSLKDLTIQQAAMLFAQGEKEKPRHAVA